MSRIGALPKLQPTCRGPTRPRWSSTRQGRCRATRRSNGFWSTRSLSGALLVEPSCSTRGWAVWTRTACSTQKLIMRRRSSMAAAAVGLPTPKISASALASQDAHSERGWRVEFRCAATASDEDEEGDEIRVEVYRGRSDAAGNLAIGRKAQTLDAHSHMIVEQARKISRKVALSPDLGKTLEIAARLHDLGKKRALWQRAMNAPDNGVIYAKTEGGGNPGSCE